MDTQSVHYLNVLLGAGAILLQAFSLVALFLIFFTKNKSKLLDFIDEYYLHLGFLVALLSSLFSLVYSEVVNFAPCVLCWYQRVFLFPLVFLFGVAIWNKDRKVIKYTLPLLVVGFLISVYQNLVYYFAETGNQPCDASGVSCYQRLVSEFGGYVSIPMLSLTAFLAILTIVLVAHFYKKEN